MRSLVGIRTDVDVTFARAALWLAVRLLVAGGLALPTAAQGMRVSRPLVAPGCTSVYDVEDFELTPDGSQVFYEARLQDGLSFHHVPISGGSSIAAAGNRSLVMPRVGERYVYATTSGGPDVDFSTLHSAPIDGSAEPLELYERDQFAVGVAPAILLSPDGA